MEDIVSGESLGFVWLRQVIKNTYSLHDKIVNYFFEKNKTLLTSFINGKYISPMGVSNIVICVEKRGIPYLPINQLNAIAQMEFFTLILQDQITDPEENCMENGMLFVFRLNYEVVETSYKEEFQMSLEGPTMEEINSYGLRFNLLFLAQETIKHLNVLFNTIYMPLISFFDHLSDLQESSLSHVLSRKSSGALRDSQTADHDISQVLKRDVVVDNFHRFQGTLKTTIQKLEGVAYLVIPREIMSMDRTKPEVKDKDMLKVIESTCKNWLSQLQDSLNALDDKLFVGTSPLDELEFWRDRYTTLDLLSKQVKNPVVAFAIEVQNKVNGLMTPTLERMEGLLIEAKENNRFLSTCERHFKNIEIGSNYQIVIETIVPLMKSLRLIWMISRHYNDDEKMVSLMEKIAKVLIDRIRKVNNFNKLFEGGSDVAMNRTANANTLLKLWKQAYLDTRQYIEISGRGARWEFDRKRLFQVSDYMANVSNDINAAVHVMEEFNQLYELNIFTVTMKPSKVTEMKNSMANLFSTFQNCKFDPYDPSNDRAWFLKMESFYKEVFDIEVVSQIHIQEAFRNIRSPVMGVQLFKSLKKVLVRSSLTKTLNEKLKDISNSFINQVNKTRQDFEENLSDPPLFKYQPPVAGAINWQRFLFVRLKNTLLTLVGEGDFLRPEEIERLKDKYLTLCKEMKAFSLGKYQDWFDKVGNEVDALLKHCVLSIPAVEKTDVKFTFHTMAHDDKSSGRASVKSVRSGTASKYKEETSSMSSSRRKQKKSSARSIANNNNNKNTSALISTPSNRYLRKGTTSEKRRPHHLPRLERLDYPNAKQINKNENAQKGAPLARLSELFGSYPNSGLTDLDFFRHTGIEVNFDGYIFEAILEARYFDAMGFKIPESIRSAAILEQSFHENKYLLGHFIKIFKSEMSKLTEVDFMVLEEHVKDLLRVVLSGTKRINWRSAGVIDFVERCHHQLELFTAIVVQYQKNIKRIEKRLDFIENAVFFSDKVNYRVGVVFDCNEYFSLLAADREDITEKLIQDYEDITSMIQHIEFVIWKSSSWKCSKMRAFYSYYENRIYEALTNMVKSNLKIFACLLSGKKTLFQIYAVLYHPYLELNPSPSSILKYISQCSAEIIYSTKYFPRWLNGSAIPFTNKRESGSYNYSFLQDIALDPEVVMLAKKIQEITEMNLSKATEALVPWKRFDVVWQSDKELAVQEWIEKTSPKAPDYDEVLYTLKDQISEINAEKLLIDIGFLLLNFSTLVTAVKDHYFHLFDLYTTDLHMDARNALVAFKIDCERKLDEISYKPSTIQDLKNVLSLIYDISNNEVDRELIIRDFTEKYDVLEIYNVSVTDEEKLILASTEGFNYLLTDKARMQSVKLKVIKRKFAETALKESIEFQNTVAEIVDKFNTSGPGTVDDLEIGLQYLREFISEVYRLEQKRQDIGNSQKLFDLPMPVYTEFFTVQKLMAEYELIYKIFKNYIDARSEWDTIKWADLNVQLLQESIDELISQAVKLPKHVKEHKIYELLNNTLKSFKNNLPIFVELKNEALRERHWKMLMDKIDFESNISGFSLKTLFAMNLSEKYDTVCEIIADAIKEANIEKAIKEIESIWTSLKFTVLKYQKRTVDKGFMIGSVEEINQILDDQIMQLQGMSASRNVGPFLNAVQTWERQLSLMSEVIYAWVIAQRKWLYLDSIFLSSDIRIQLPEEAKLFDKLDKNYANIMKETAMTPLVKNSCLAPHRLSMLEELIIGLDKCQKSLNDYLDSKRNAFPRFFFISDDELLSIIGSTDPLSIQEHIIKMFDNIASLNFKPAHGGLLEVHAMVSTEGEQMYFKRKVSADGKVEMWMSGVLEAMKDANRLITKEAIFCYCEGGMTRTDWTSKFQGMVCLAANAAWWTWEVEDVFQKTAQGDKQAMKTYSKKLIQQIDDIVILIRTQLNSNDRKKFNTVLIIDLHARDIIDGFVKDSILTASDFKWESQLRFYWDQNLDQIIIFQCNGKFVYGHEYMGLNGRLVVTPLTDRIYLTLTQALSMRLGGSPEGPAGTGKTETTKDLAKALGLLCVVTNCGEGLDYKAVGKIFSGLCQSGSWGCFDEFNRIDISVLSVITSQLQVIRNALLLNVTSFAFEGEVIALDDKVGIFITMNPGYSGRTELPDSIKALFRPVVCIVPDLQMICEVMLFSEGFLMAKTLAKKMVVLYKLAREQLSRQYHYDFQLRAIKSVLVMAGELKRNSDFEEDVVLMRALRDMNLPKFVFDDVPLFLGLITDLFPGLSCPRVQYPEFAEAVEQSLKENKYVVLPEQVDKVIQMFETMMTRHSTMVVGPTCGGKSVVISILAQAQTKLGIPTKLYTLNPKERSVVELYGVLNSVTRDWTDGLLSNIFRDINRTTDKVERRYIVFDGDVDALWIENMNSVMDDNKLLTLANGERIRMQKQCSLLFEVSDLQYANPSTVSRCGMVYVDPKNLKYTPYWQRWLQMRFEEKQNVKEVEFLTGLYSTIVPKVIEYIFEGKIGEASKEPLKTIIPLTDLSMIKQLTHMLDALLDDDMMDSPDEVENIFTQALCWSLGAGLIENDRIKFDMFVTKLSNLIGASATSEGEPPPVGGLEEEEYTMFDLCWDKKSHSWVTWSSKVPEYIHDPTVDFNEILVPTKDTVCLKWILSLFLNLQVPILFSGESGTNKTSTIKSFLKSLNTDDYQLLEMNFSSRTTSWDCQRNLESHTEKRTRDVFGPPIGKRLAVFIDDLNMPQVDTYGTQQPIAMLKLLLGYNGFYDRGSLLNWKTLKDVDWIASMGNPGGGRNSVDPRFISLFSFINVVFPSDQSIFRIYNSILGGHTMSFSQEIKDTVESITTMTMTLFKVIVKGLLPTPSKFHYVFNLRDISRLYCGLSCITPLKFTTKNQMMRVWRHECLRVFTDRLVNDKDKKFINDNIKQLVEANIQGDSASYVLADPIIFGDYATAMELGAPKFYEDLDNYARINEIFQQILEEYQRSIKFSLVLFDDALENLSRIYRVLRLPQGHCLLTGHGSVGKISMSRLAAFAAGYETFTIELSRGYNETTFREDLKALYEKLCLQNLKVVFLFRDRFILEEDFLELINNMLTLGIVPALYDDSEKDKIVEELQSEVMQLVKSPTKDLIWQFFSKRATQNLHIILSMTSANPNLAKRCRNFPGIVNNTHINWVFPWPKQALLAVANDMIVIDEKIIKAEFLEQIVSHAVFTHISVIEASEEYFEKMRRRNYVSPKNYIDFLSTYLRLLLEHDSFIDAQCNRLEGGMTKLVESGKQLDILNFKLSVQRVAVNEKTLACQKLLAKISVATAEAEAKQGMAQNKGNQIEIQSKDITKEKEEATVVLSKALPALEGARLALDDIDRNDVTEIRSFAKPPKPVQTIGECIVVLKGIKDVSWKSAKGLMIDPNFLRSLKEMDVDNIPYKNVNVVKFLLKEMNITIEEMRDKSRAGAGLMKFVQAVVAYCDVYKDVKPKKEKVERLEKEFNLTMNELTKITSQLELLEATLSGLNTQYEQAMIEKKTLEDETDLMQKRLHAADRLIKGLSSEKVRWQTDLQDLHDQKDHIVGDCILCAGFLAYTAAFTWQYREDLVHKLWLENLEELEIPVSDPFSLLKLLTNEVEISRWSSEGLPSDDLSIQNAILVTKSSRFPMCIDPQQQAINWIKQREKGNNFKISNFNDTDYVKHLELAIRYGSPFLFQDVDDYIDPLINDILSKDVKKTGASLNISIGDKLIDYDPNFRLYLTTKNPFPNLAANVYGIATVINFMVTLKGLEDQLLGVIVKVEKNELEERREQLIHETSNNKKLLKELEDSLLRELAHSKGNMLDNTELLNTLENTKLKSTEVAEKLRLAALTSDEIDRNRDIYRPIAKMGAVMFFVLADMAIVNSMYQYSLSSYIKVFENSLRRSLPDTRVTIRLRNISEMLKRNVYNYGCTGIFERHKLLYSFQITIKLKLDEGVVNEEEFEFFTKGNVSLEKSEIEKPFKWLTDDTWECLLLLQTISKPAFVNLITDMESNADEWESWCNDDSPESIDLPDPYNESLSSFQKLMLLRCFRMDRLYCAISDYIMHIMGEHFVTPQIVSLNNIYEQSLPSIPVVFILSVGSDPTNDLMNFADELGIKNTHLKILSLGQGQEKIAMALLTAGMAHGHWIILQNCHLMLSFLRELEKEFENFSKPHPDFRLWLTTEPVEAFPISVLQRSLKVVTEPPNGLKHNLRNTYLKLISPVLDKDCTHPSYPSLLYVLSFFHAVIQERRKYGKIGWNIIYDFNTTDFQVCNVILQNTLQKLEDGVIPWTSLKYLVGEVMYGGRVIDDFDRRIINTYMDEYMGDFLLDPFQKFHFGIEPNYEYTLAVKELKEDYLAFIEDLPMATTPQVLGLHPNAEISYFMNAGQNVLDYMKSLQPKTGGQKSSTSREEEVDKIAKDMLVKIPEEFNVEKVREEILQTRSITPSIVVLLQEIDRFNNLTSKLLSSLKNLRQAIAGEVGMNNDLEEISNSLYYGSIPTFWRRLAPDTKKSLSSWIVYHLERHKQYFTWAFDSEPEVLWMSGLHVPESYLTALVQMTCRKHGWPLDKSTLFTKVLTVQAEEEALETSGYGKMITGLYLEGASWDLQNCCLIRQEPKKLAVLMPTIKIIPIPSNKLRLSNALRTPVYVTSDRRNSRGVGLVFEADLNTRQHLSHWILQGVCLVLNPEC